MAYQDSKQILRVALSGFDEVHLQKIVVAAYDRWNWDTGSEVDKDWFEIAEEILKERGINVNTGNPQGLNFTNNSGVTIPVLTMNNSTQELVLGTSKTLSVVDSSVSGNMTHELFEVNQSNNLELGYELKQAIVAFMANEIANGTTLNHSGGQTVKQAIECEIDMRAPQAVKNML